MSKPRIRVPARPIRWYDFAIKREGDEGTYQCIRMDDFGGPEEAWRLALHAARTGESPYARLAA